MRTQRSSTEPQPLTWGAAMGATHRALLTCAGLLLLLAAPATAQRNCKKGKPCGNTCIAVDKVCRVAAPAPLATPAPSADPMPYRGGPFVGSIADQVYFLEGCSAAQDLAPTNRLKFLTAPDADRAGYRRSRVPGC